MVPLQITDSHQRERRAASSLHGLIHPFSFAGEGVEIDNGGFAAKLGKMDTVFSFIVKVYIVRIIRFLL